MMLKIIGPTLVSHEVISDPNTLKLRGIRNGQVVQDCGIEWAKPDSIRQLLLTCSSVTWSSTYPRLSAIYLKTLPCQQGQLFWPEHLQAWDMDGLHDRPLRRETSSQWKFYLSLAHLQTLSKTRHRIKGIRYSKRWVYQGLCSVLLLKLKKEKESRRHNIEELCWKHEIFNQWI